MDPILSNPTPNSDIPDDPIEKATRLNVASQQHISNFVAKILENHKQNRELAVKMDAIDVAYARYKELSESTTQTTPEGVDIRDTGNYPCDVFASDNVTPPIVVAQVDTYLAYLAEVFLSGYPLFPVVSNPANKVWAEQLETLLDDHATLGAYPRHLLLFLRDGVKYNFAGLEIEWDQVDQFSVGFDFASGTGKRVDRTAKYFNRIKRINPRNMFYDQTCLPSEVSEAGDYVGYIERISRMRAKKEILKLQSQKRCYNAGKALNPMEKKEFLDAYYTDDPQVSNYVHHVTNRNKGIDWDTWFDGKAAHRRGTQRYGDQFYRVVVYARILPADFQIGAPSPNTPQIWKFVHLNDTLVEARRIVSAYDYLPILIGQPLEDGLGLQTQSVAEGEMPFQEAATTLFNIRFAAARRAVSDRALYDVEHLSQRDVNTRAAAPKIPVRISALSKKTLGDLYYPIPFDSRGLENVLQDAQTLVGFSKELHGGNNPRTGQFQKGNKSVQEWNDTMAGSDNRYRLPAMVLEYQVFSPMKSIMVLNIYQNASEAKVVSQRNGNTVTINVDELRKQVLAFRVADGYSPKSKLASVDMLTMAFQLIQNSPILQQQYGAYLPGLFSHMMQLGGVRGFDEYNPANVQQGNIQPGNLPGNTLSTPVVGPAAGNAIPTGQGGNIP